MPFRLIVSERGVDHYRYVPAYSTRLNYESGTWRVLPSDSSDPMGMVDPVWTESNWDTIRLRVYTVQDAAFDRLVLLAGITITVMAYLAIVLTRASIAKALKRDWSIILVLVNFMNILHRNGRIRSKDKWFYHNLLLKSLVFFSWTSAWMLHFWVASSYHTRNSRHWSRASQMAEFSCHYFKTTFFSSV